MSSDCSNSSKGDLGNTKAKSQDSPCKRWVFTLNNYTEDEYLSIKEFFSSNGSKYSIGKEIGDSGTPHLQGYIELYTKKRFKYMKDIIPRGHIEKAKKSRKDNIAYTQKDKNYIQNFKEEVYFEEIAECLQPVKKWMLDYDFPKGDRKINVVVDYKGGIGKTEFCRWAVIHMPDTIVTGGKASDMKNQIVDYLKEHGKCPKYILLDVPRKSTAFLSYQGIEEVKNMLFYSGKYEGGMVCGNKPFMCIFMNSEPDYNSMSTDRWNVLKINEDYWDGESQVSP